MDKLAELLSGIYSDPVTMALAGLAVAATLIFLVLLRRDARKAAPAPIEVVEERPERPEIGPPAVHPVASTYHRPVTVGAPAPHFTGRCDAIGEVTRSLSPDRVTVIHGRAPSEGLGKTALAEYVAHAELAKGRFSDGAVAIDLQADGGKPLSPREALQRLLSDIGVTVGAPPPGADDRRIASMLAYQWRRETANRDMLVFFDNARDAEQIERLAPGAGPSVLVTSRGPLAMSDAGHVTIAPTPREEALALVGKLAPDLPDELARRLAAIAPPVPIAIETAALAVALSTRAPDRIVAAFAGLPGGSAEERTLAFLECAVDQLDEDLGAAWSALSLFEGGFFAESAAALWGVTRGEAERWLNRLQHRRLVSRTPLILPFDRVLGDRWRLHDMLRPIASARLARDSRSGDAWMGWLRATAAMVERAGRLYEAGGDGAAHGLALLDLELADVVSAIDSVAGMVDRDNAAADVAMRLPRWPILAARLDPETMERLLAAGLVGARRLGDAETERRLAAMIEGEPAEADVAEEPAFEAEAADETEGLYRTADEFLEAAAKSLEPVAADSEPSAAEADRAEESAPLAEAAETAADDQTATTDPMETLLDEAVKAVAQDDAASDEGVASAAQEEAAAGEKTADEPVGEIAASLGEAVTPKAAKRASDKGAPDATRPRLRPVRLERFDEEDGFALNAFSLDADEPAATREASLLSATAAGSGPH